MNILCNCINRQLDGETSIIVICKNEITGVLPFTRIEDVRPCVNSPPWGNKTYLPTNYLLVWTKTFFVNLMPVVLCPGPTALKETEQILTNRRSQTGKGMRCPASTYIYSEAEDRNPNKRSNLGLHNCIPS